MLLLFISLLMPAGASASRPAHSSLGLELQERASAWDLAKEHGAGLARQQKAHAAALERLMALRAVEENLKLSQPGTPGSDPNASVDHHTNASSKHEQMINETDVCKECALAEENLIVALQAAQETHSEAQQKAEDWALAKGAYEVASEEFSTALVDHTATKDELSSMTMTYRSSDEEYSTFVRLAQQFHAQAQSAVQAESWEGANKTLADTARSLYDTAAIAALAADDNVEEKLIQKQSVCTKYEGLATTPPTDLGSSLPVTDGLHGHWDASVRSSLQLDGSAVAQWGDLSGKDMHVMAPGAHRPQLVPDGINGHPSLYFSGAERALASEVTHPTHGKAPFTWFVAAVSKSASGYQNIFSTNDAPWSHLNLGHGAKWRCIAVTNNGWHGWAGPSDLNVGTLPRNLMAVLTLWFDGTTAKIYWGSELKGSAHVGGWGQVQEGYVVMGHAMQNAHDYTGYIGEVAAFTRALPEAEIFKVVEALEQKWA